MKVGDSIQYKFALEALIHLKQYVPVEKLQPLAAFLFYAESAETVDRTHPWVGTDSPLDREIVAAYKQAWEDFIQGDDDDD
ncbi:MAG: hypothetical protein LRZ84_14755 [Desertifilum sp.]|nr:hypothetical protein [Desertifilum sp.]